MHRLDGAGRGAHAVADARALEGGAGGGGGAEKAGPVADDDLAVRPEVGERRGGGGFVQARREDPGEDVAADESPEVGEEVDFAAGRKIPGEVGGKEAVGARACGLEGGARKRRGVDPAEEVAHRGIADDRDPVQGRPGDGGPGEKRLDHRADVAADEVFEGRAAVASERELDPAHDVGAVAGLGVQRGPHAQDPAVRKIEQLRDDRRRAEVHGGAEAAEGLERECFVVREDGGLPLAYVEDEVAIRARPAGEPEAGGDLAGREDRAIVRGGQKIPLEDPDAAAPAAPEPAAREFEPPLEKDVLERRPALALDRLAERLEPDADAVGHGDSAKSLAAATPAQQEGGLCNT